MRQTSASRFSRAVKKIAEWCRRNRHQPVPEQHATLSQKLRGHDGYYGIIGNSRALSNLRRVVTRIWRKWLSRRSWAGRFSWERFKRLLACFALPPPRVVHSVYRLTAKL
jgi:RNA-directed DNA polymerase